MLLPSLCYLSNTSKFETYGLSVAKWSSKVWILLENISGKMGAKIALEREVFVSYYGWMRHLFNLFFFLPCVGSCPRPFQVRVLPHYA